LRAQLGTDFIEAPGFTRVPSVVDGHEAFDILAGPLGRAWCGRCKSTGGRAPKKVWPGRGRRGAHQRPSVGVQVADGSAGRRLVRGTLPDRGDRATWTRPWRPFRGPSARACPPGPLLDRLRPRGRYVAAVARRVRSLSLGRDGSAGEPTWPSSWLSGTDGAITPTTPDGSSSRWAFVHLTQHSAGLMRASRTTAQDRDRAREGASASAGRHVGWGRARQRVRLGNPQLLAVAGHRVQ
jgi:hypothetical protein